MSIKLHIYPSLIALAFTGLLAGCSTVALKPGAETVKVINVPAPKSCQFLGGVVNEDVNGATQSYTSHEHLQIDQLNTLKNKALALGANVIVLTDHQTTYAQRNALREKYQGAPTITVVDTHRMAGEAYHCNSQVIDRLQSQDANSLSDIKNNN